MSSGTKKNRFSRSEVSEGSTQQNKRVNALKAVQQSTVKVRMLFIKLLRSDGMKLRKVRSVQIAGKYIEERRGDVRIVSAEGFGIQC